MTRVWGNAAVLLCICFASQAQEPGAVADPADISCPAYPSAVRTEIAASLRLDQEFAEYARSAIRLRRRLVPLDSKIAQSSGFIDQAIYNRMAADGVEPAPRTNDAE